jgi:hypothetical protein
VGPRPSRRSRSPRRASGAAITAEHDLRSGPGGDSDPQSEQHSDHACPSRERANGGRGRRARDAGATASPGGHGGAVAPLPPLPPSSSPPPPPPRSRSLPARPRSCRPCCHCRRKRSPRMTRRPTPGRLAGLRRRRDHVQGRRRAVGLGGQKSALMRVESGCLGPRLRVAAPSS